MQAFIYKGYEIEVVFSGAPGWFDFYINGKPWGCDRANKLTSRIDKAIAIKESKEGKKGGAL